MDAELMRDVAAGDAIAQRELVVRLLPRVRATTRYLARNDAEADDMAQLALIEIVKSAGSFRGNSRIERWADRIVTRTVFHRVRRRTRRESVVESVGEELGESRESPHTDAVRRVLQRRMAHHLARLSPERRAAVVLKLVHGHTVDEIAEITEVSVNTVKDRLKTGRRKLRDMLRRDPSMREFIGEIVP